MEHDLNKLCAQEKPVNRNRIKLIQEADRGTIEDCLKNENCQPWFLDEVFRHRYDNDDILIKEVICHSNCPHYLIALVDNINPSWLDNSSAMAEIQLSMLEADGKKAWEKLKREYQKKSISDLINYRLYLEDIRFLHKEFNKKEDDIMAELYRRTPEFIIGAYLKDKTNHETMAEYLPHEMLEKYMSYFEPKIRAVAAERHDLTESIYLSLFKDKSMLVRKAIAENSHTSEHLLLTLAQDKNLKIVEAALKQLPETQRDPLIKKKLTSGRQTSKEQNQLMILRMPKLHPEALCIIAEVASPLFCCAATLHKSADKRVIQVAEKRTDLPLWAKIGIALKSENEELLKELIETNDIHIHIALSDNVNMTKENALALINHTKKDRVLANIANHYINDDEMLHYIIEYCERHSLWLKNMAPLLDRTTKATKLRQLNGEFQRDFLVLSRLKARHPNCPKPYFHLLAYYLPDDVILNPTYNELLKKGDDAARPQANDAWEIDQQLDSGYASEYLTSWINTRSTTNLTNKRKTISCSDNNPNQVRTLVIVDDSHTHRRFIHRYTSEYSEYEYRMLMHVASGATKKAIIEKHRLSDEFIINLANEKDKLVSTAALEIATRRGLDVALKVDKKSLKSLGNKPARLALANESNDPEILNMLIHDKTRDVRMAVAERSELEFESLVTLLKDPDVQVVQNSLSTIYYKKLESSQRHKCELFFQQIVNDEKRSDKLKTWAFNYIADPEFIDARYKKGEGLFDKIILSKTANNEFLDQAIFEALRGHKTISPYTLSENPNLNLKQCRQLMTHKPELIKKLVNNISSAEEIISLYKMNGSNFYNDGWSLKHKVDFTESEIKLLYNSLGKRDFINLTQQQLHKLDDTFFSDLLAKIYPCVVFYEVIYNKHYSKDKIKYLFDFIMNNKNWDDLAYFIECYPIESHWIDDFLTHKSKSVRLALVENQKLSQKQVMVACQDASFDVQERLFYSDKINRNQLPDEFLIKLVCRNDDSWLYDDKSSFQSQAIAELKSRNVSLPDSCKPCNATSILSQFNVSLSAVKFNKMMIDKGFLEISKRESENEPGKYRESKKLTKQAKKYGYNDSNYNGDYTPIYYPVFFHKLLHELDIEVEK